MTISEALAVSARTKKPVKCPFHQAEKHPSSCICRGTMKVTACQDCAGSGWDATAGRICQHCGGGGAHK